MNWDTLRDVLEKQREEDKVARLAGLRSDLLWFIKNSELTLEELNEIIGVMNLVERELD